MTDALGPTALPPNDMIGVIIPLTTGGMPTCSIDCHHASAGADSPTISHTSAIRLNFTASSPKL